MANLFSYNNFNLNILSFGFLNEIKGVCLVLCTNSIKNVFKTFCVVGKCEKFKKTQFSFEKFKHHLSLT